MIVVNNTGLIRSSTVLIIASILFKYPDENAKFYQEIFNETLEFLKDLNTLNYQKLQNKFLTN